MGFVRCLPDPSSCVARPKRGSHRGPVPLGGVETTSELALLARSVPPGGSFALSSQSTGDTCFSRPLSEWLTEMLPARTHSRKANVAISAPHSWEVNVSWRHPQFLTRSGCRGSLRGRGWVDIGGQLCLWVLAVTQALWTISDGFTCFFP